MVSPSNKRKVTREKLSTHKEGSKSLNAKLAYKPLHNKRFYLDINNYKGIENLKKELNHFGGVIDNFIVKEVNYVITTRNFNPPSKGSSSETQQASPSTPQPVSSVPSVSCNSPLNLDSPKEDNKKRVCTRADVLLERACLKKQGTSDVLENARLWAIPVWTLSKLLKLLSNLKESPLYRPPKSSAVNSKRKSEVFSSKSNSTSLYSGSSSKIKKLQEPFIKVEGFERKYKPHFKELPKWPTINLECHHGTSPFADRKVSKEKSKFLSAHKESYSERHKNLPGANKDKGGFCELCSAHYSDLRLHLQSDSHLTFIRDKNNYASLDELINDYDMKILMH